MWRRNESPSRRRGNYRFTISPGAKWGKRAGGREYVVVVTDYVLPVPRERRPFCEMLNTAHKRGTPCSGLNDEKELGHVANAGTVPADGCVRACRTRERRVRFSVRPSRKMNAENVNIVRNKYEIYKLSRDIRIHKSTNDTFSLITSM